MAYRFGVRRAFIATYNDTDDYGTNVRLLAINQVEMQTQTVNAQLEGDDIIADTHAQSTSAQLRLRFGNGTNNMEVLSVLTGLSIESNPPDRALSLTDNNYPYIGFIAQVYDTSGAGDQWLFIPKCKAMSGVPYSARYGGYVINDFTLTGVLDDTYGIWKLYENATAATPTIPPSF